MYKPHSCTITVTVPHLVRWKEYQDRFIFNLLAASGYAITYSLDEVYMSPRGKHFKLTMGISADDHDVSATEAELLLQRYLTYQALH